jgi:hypothetical protein
LPKSITFILANIIIRCSIRYSCFKLWLGFNDVDWISMNNQHRWRGGEVDVLIARYGERRMKIADCITRRAGHLFEFGILKTGVSIGAPAMSPGGTSTAAFMLFTLLGEICLVLPRTLMRDMTAWSYGNDNVTASLKINSGDTDSGNTNNVDVGTTGDSPDTGSSKSSPADARGSSANEQQIQNFNNRNGNYQLLPPWFVCLAFPSTRVRDGYSMAQIL